mmetsp:Transcript_34746/g.76100  ORF Transcript_34746/g.76100 Transcript_34746/m.76100 type:complete len:96 (+) Transcript_34746:436-723(+)
MVVPLRFRGLKVPSRRFLHSRMTWILFQKIGAIVKMPLPCNVKRKVQVVVRLCRLKTLPVCLRPQPRICVGSFWQRALHLEVAFEGNLAQWWKGR